MSALQLISPGGHLVDMEGSALLVEGAANAVDSILPEN